MQCAGLCHKSRSLFYTLLVVPNTQPLCIIPGSGRYTLAAVAGPQEFLGVGQRSRPEEVVPHGLCRYGLGRRVMAALSLVDAFEQSASFCRLDAAFVDAGYATLV